MGYVKSVSKKNRVMKKKAVGAILLFVGVSYFFAVFCCTDLFENINEVLSYIFFISAMLAVLFGLFLLFFQTPEEYEEERIAKQTEEQKLQESSLCRPFVFYIFIGINLAAFFIVNMLQGADSVLDYAVSKYDCAFYRIVSSMFVHINIEHLLFNTVALFVLGKRTEALIGHKHFIAIYLSSGLCSSAFLALFSTLPCVGASGAVFGIFGFFFMTALNNRKVIKYTFWRELLPVAVVNLAITFLSPHISVIAHLTGFECGTSFFLRCKKVKIEGKAI